MSSKYLKKPLYESESKHHFKPLGSKYLTSSSSKYSSKEETRKIYSEGEKRYLNPWNEKNHLITENDIFEIFEKANIPRDLIKINNLDLYQTAFIHSSYIKSKLDDSIELTEKPSGVLDMFDDHPDYENQEFLGDRCIEMAVAFYIFKRYPDSDQGFKTVLKTKIVRKNTLALFARYLDIPKHLIISKVIEDKTEMGRNNTRILEDVMEAFVCAIFLDNNNNSKSDDFMGMGWQVVYRFVEFLLEKVVDFEELLMAEENHKETLLQYYQKEFKITPEYIDIKVEGPPNSRIFTQGVLDKYGRIIARGVGKTKKDAQQAASLEALKYFGEGKDKDDE